MQTLIILIEFLMNLQYHLTDLISSYGLLAYFIIFAVIFSETGLVVAPFLPGDSLLFVIGALGVSGQINIVLITILIMVAAIAGNTVNYYIGRFLGPKVFEHGSRFFKQENLIRTHAFFERHGGKAIVLSRFLPIIRTFTPFVAGIGKMHYVKFFIYNIIGAVSWVLTFILGGYFFGNIPAVRENFILVIVALLVFSLMPALYASLQQLRKNKTKNKKK